MINKVLSISVAVLSLGTSVAVAASLTDRLATERMTVVQVDRSQHRFLCAEHRHWTRISKTDVAVLASGDIVTVHRPAAGLPRVKVVRTAAEELGSPER
jgi:hypothetical protein